MDDIAQLNKANQIVTMLLVRGVVKKQMLQLGRVIVVTLQADVKHLPMISTTSCVLPCRMPFYTSMFLPMKEHSTIIITGANCMLILLLTKYIYTN